ncbi:MAG: alpha/beta fold hydrolase [Gammaproteobacteria bacterium]|nr:alpha/beta fold hydrolase [Gammaproteobacteria bacterium]
MGGSYPPQSPLLLIPGTWLDGRLFAAQRQALSTECDVQLADVSRSDSIDAMAADVLADAPPRFALVGLSMGGIVALEIQRRAPERVTHLGLFDTTPRPEAPERAHARVAALEAVARGDAESLVRDTLAPNYLAHANRTDPGLIEAVVRMALDLGPEVFVRQSIALERRGSREHLLPAIACPTLVLCGAEDRLCPVSLHVAMAAAIPDADLVVLARSGHLSPLERPAAVTDEIRRLLSRPQPES